jgi:hypothetical protein
MLSNRDLASLAWIAVLAALVLSRRGGREAIRGILPSLAAFFLPIAVFWAYLTAVVVVAWNLGLWNRNLGKDAIVWALVPGLALFFSFMRASKERRFYIRTLGRVIGLTAIVEFYANLNAFSLPIELFLVPAVAFLALMSAMAALKPEYQILKRVADPLLFVIGSTVLVATALYLAGNWNAIDEPELARQFGLPVWLTLAALPFVFAFSLYANYQSQFVRFEFVTKDDRRARRRAKLALLLSYGLRNHELSMFSGRAISDLATAKNWREARRVIEYRRAEARVEEAQRELAAARLTRYEGVAGADWDGRPYDEREFEDTKTALVFLASMHRARYDNGRYRRDLMAIVKGIVSRTLPEDEFVMRVDKDRRSWFAWRRTVGGWYLGIGGVGAPTEDWVYLADHEPPGFPSAETSWREGAFPTSIESEWDTD